MKFICLRKTSAVQLQQQRSLRNGMLVSKETDLSSELKFIWDIHSEK